MTLSFFFPIFRTYFLYTFCAKSLLCLSLCIYAYGILNISTALWISSSCSIQIHFCTYQSDRLKVPCKCPVKCLKICATVNKYHTGAQHHEGRKRIGGKWLKEEYLHAIYQVQLIPPPFFAIYG